MKKILFAILLFSCGVCLYASENLEQQSILLDQAQTTTYYQGQAWQNVGGTYIGRGGNPINIEWSTEGLWINGEYSTLRVFELSGEGYLMMINGSCICCTHYVSINGVRYFFCCN